MLRLHPRRRFPCDNEDFDQGGIERPPAIDQARPAIGGPSRGDTPCWRFGVIVRVPMRLEKQVLSVPRKLEAAHTSQGAQSGMAGWGDAMHDVSEGVHSEAIMAKVGADVDIYGCGQGEGGQKPGYRARDVQFENEGR